MVRGAEEEECVSEGSRLDGCCLQTTRLTGFSEEELIRCRCGLLGHAVGYRARHRLKKAEGIEGMGWDKVRLAAVRSFAFHYPSCEGAALGSVLSFLIWKYLLSR